MQANKLKNQEIHKEAIKKDKQTYRQILLQQHLSSLHLLLVSLFCLTMTSTVLSSRFVILK